MTKKVLIIMAEKSETVEIVVPADILGKIDGIEVTIASVHGKDEVRTSSDIVITPDVGLAQVDEDGFDAIVIPGGFGYKILEKSELVGKILKNHYSKGKIVAAICFGPVVFLSHAIGLGNRITSYPGVEQEFREKYEYLEDPVVQDKVNFEIIIKLNFETILNNFRT